MHYSATQQLIFKNCTLEAPLPLKRSGRLAQLVEHLVYTERVGSSSLSSPTSFDNAI